MKRNLYRMGKKLSAIHKKYENSNNYIQNKTKYLFLASELNGQGKVVNVDRNYETSRESM